MQQTTSHPAPVHSAFLNLGFRPFFTMAAVFAVLSMLAWMGVTVFGWQPDFTELPATTWHAHEMIYGYSLAV
ncbi:MAG: NnrS family protein, partial [Gammaproteobacteria bacterium]|nr:NnrS family protein [Gammaproteobacteria bacterium]